METSQDDPHPEIQQATLRTNLLQTNITSIHTSKILEKLVLQNITPHIPLFLAKQGFRPNHSTNTLHTHMMQTILEGLNPAEPAFRTNLTTDFSKAFDLVPRH